MDCPSTPEARIKLWRDYATLCRQTAGALEPETYNQGTWLHGFITSDQVPSAELSVAEQISACGSAACLAGTMTFIHPEAREALMTDIASVHNAQHFGGIVQSNLDLFTPGNVTPWLYSGDPTGYWPAPFDDRWAEVDRMPDADLDECEEPECDCHMPSASPEEKAQMRVDIAKAMLTELVEVIEDQCNNATDVVTCDWDETDDDGDRVNDPWEDLFYIINSHS